MADDSDPPRKFFQLKPKEFDAVNQHAPRQPAAPGETGPQDPGPNAADHGRIDVRDLFKQAHTPGKTAARNKLAGANDVHAMLADNHARADAAGLNRVEHRPRRASRRQRDYWLLMVAFNAFFGIAAFSLGRNPMTLAYGLGGMILVSLGLTWIMWFVMDDY